MVEHNGRIDEAMAEAVATTMENMFFLEIEAAEDACPEPADALLNTRLRITEPVQAKIALEVPRAMLLELTEGLFEAEEEEAGEEDLAKREQVLFDTLAEILNTIAGQFMGLTVDDDEVFRLGLPQTTAGTSPLAGESAWRFATDTGHCFSMYLEAGAFAAG